MTQRKHILNAKTNKCNKKAFLNEQDKTDYASCLNGWNGIFIIVFQSGASNNVTPRKAVWKYVELLIILIFHSDICGQQRKT